jgi:hypothetical protein
MNLDTQDKSCNYRNKKNKKKLFIYLADWNK